MNASLILLAFGLAADAFAVSVTQGAAAQRNVLRTAFAVALAFGVAQALAPLIGWALGTAFAGYIEQWDHWVAFVLLALIGVKMIRDGLKPGETQPELSRGVGLLGLAIATSIDAAAAGIALPALEAPLELSLATIGAITFVMCFAGVWIGQAGSRLIGAKATIVGGLILMGIGVKVLIDHQAFG